MWKFAIIGAALAVSASFSAATPASAVIPKPAVCEGKVAGWQPSDLHVVRTHLKPWFSCGNAR